MPRAPRPGPKSPQTTERHRVPSFTGPNLPGALEDTAGRLTKARAAQAIWSTLRALGHRTE